jgi:STE24 endopeptidase
MGDVISQTIPGEDRAKRYSELKHKLSIRKSLLSFCVLFFIFISGLSKEFEKISYSFSHNDYFALLVFVFLIGLVEGVVTFPLSFYSAFIIEHKFNLSNQTLFSYFKEELKGFAVGAVLGIPVILIFYYIIKNYPSVWWLIMGIVLFIFSTLVARIMPVLILPLFYKFKPVENESLNKKILALSEKTGVRIKGVFTFNMSKDTKKANAAFTGLGKSKRIILGDTLLENFTENEIESVFAHELGHYRMKHIRKLLLLSTVITFSGLYLTSLLYSKSLSFFYIPNVWTLSALPLLLLYLFAFFTVISPLSNYVSRRFEWQADKFALQICSDNLSFASALEKLAEQNLSDKNPKKKTEILFHSHPSLSKRIDYAKNFKKS